MGTTYCYDTEFLEDGHTIELISIGIVSDTGREYYAVNSDMPYERIQTRQWLCENVIPQLPLGGRPATVQRHTGTPAKWYWSLDLSDTRVKPRWVIANEVREFLLAETEPVLWADYPAYDHVVLAQLWGSMINLPKGLPMRTRDIEQEIDRHPDFVRPTQGEGAHNALFDARHNLTVLRALRDYQAATA
ncbi:MULTISPECIES: 3'-5' exoribonuclease domain-containing protein [Nocardia]|uniref:3'-5' exoribonuclease domain-containing protein n=1 Tax=Nocardia TaxID=1817 RepID=UPI0024548D77|nr:MULTISPECIES: 3'-5' exoribonuclease [Nocardia]